MLRAFLAPALGLLQTWRLSVKLGLMGALVCVPLVWLAQLAILELREQRHVTELETEGAQVVNALLDVAVQLQTRRGQANMLLSGKADVAGPLQATQTRLAETVRQADALLGRHPEWGAQAQWAPIRQQLEAWTQGLPQGDRAQLFRQHTEQVAALRSLVRRVGEDSKLLFDPEAATFFLMDLMVEHALDWTEQIGLLRGQGAGLLTKGQAEP